MWNWNHPNLLEAKSKCHNEPFVALKVDFSVTEYKRRRKYERSELKNFNSVIFCDLKYVSF